MFTEVLSVLKTSLQVSLFSAFIVLNISLLLAPYLLRKNSCLKILELFFYLPMAIPPVALGYLLLIFFGPNSLLGQILEKCHFALAFNFKGAVVASSLASLGIGLRIMKLAFKNLNPDLLHIAHLQGASRWQSFYYIKLPLLKPSLCSAGLLVFLRSLGEFGATMIFAGNILGESRTFSLAIWTALQSPEQENLAFLFLLCSVLISLIALIFSELVFIYK